MGDFKDTHHNWHHLSYQHHEFPLPFLKLERNVGGGYGTDKIEIALGANVTMWLPLSYVDAMIEGLTKMRDYETKDTTEVLEDTRQA